MDSRRSPLALGSAYVIFGSLRYWKAIRRDDTSGDVTRMLEANDPAELAGLIRADYAASWHGMISTGNATSDYPLQAICTCGQRAIRPDWHSPWRHRLPDEQIDEPADAEF